MSYFFFCRCSLQETAVVVLLLSKKVDFKANLIRKDGEGHLILFYQKFFRIVFHFLPCMLQTQWNPGL